MQVDLPELDAPATINRNRKVSAEDFGEFCAANPSLGLELRANGEIAIRPSTGGESSYRRVVVAARLFSWVRTDRRGNVFGSSAAGSSA
jgi:Uma2 family endonuclease